MTLSEFVKKYLNKQVEYHSFNPAAKYQCTDLVNQYIDEVLGLTPIIGTNAKDFPSKVKTNEFEFVKNTPDLIPQKGWIAVWNGRVGSGAGHIAIVRDDKATVNQFNSIDQNWSKPLYTTLETHNYKNISGFLKPKGQNMSKMVQVEASKFEELVNKATKWDEVAKLGVDPKALIQDLKKCELAKSEMGDKVKEARERIEQLEKDLETEKRSKAQMVSRADYNQLLEEKQTLEETVEELENKPALVGKRKLTAGIVAGVLILISVILEKTMGLDLSPQDLLIILAGPVSYIGAEGTADIIRVIKDQQGLLLSEKTDK
jgi:surface antigen